MTLKVETTQPEMGVPCRSFGFKLANFAPYRRRVAPDELRDEWRTSCKWDVRRSYLFFPLDKWLPGNLFYETVISYRGVFP